VAASRQFDLALAGVVGLEGQAEVWAPSFAQAGGNLHHVGPDVFNAAASGLELVEE
jgi:hypothetical protein